MERSVTAVIEDQGVKIAQSTSQISTVEKVDESGVATIRTKVIEASLHEISGVEREPSLFLDPKR